MNPYRVSLAHAAALLTLLATTQFLSSCSSPHIKTLAQIPREEKSDCCVELFDAAWTHIDRIKKLQPSAAFAIAPRRLWSGLLGSDEKGSGDAYERERSRLGLTIQTMTDQGCPPSDLLGALTRR